MLIGANHYTLAVSDLDRSFKFYRDILGLKPLCKWPKGAYFLARDFWFCLNLDTNRKSEPDAHYTHFAFTVSKTNFLKVVELLIKSGVSPFKENSSSGDSFYFLDPDGYCLEIHTETWHNRLDAFKKLKRADVEYFI